jgi:NADH-quinone oxidoreductase subunit N
MNMGTFAIVTLIARRNDRQTSVDDYNGIGFLSPVLAFSLSLFLLSLLGIPLTAGFMGKVMVFTTAVRQGYVWLVVIGVLNSALSAYYYLRLIIVMFFRERNAPWEAPRMPASLALALVLTVAGVFYLGLFPGSVLSAFGATPSNASSIR